MTNQNIKQLETELWDAADDLRANSKLTAAEYKDPLLGLVLLRFAQNRYEDAKIEVYEKLSINPRTGEKREANKGDYAAAGAIMLPEKAKYEYLANLPEGENIAEAINNAMKLIEDEYPDLEGILPKSYQEFDDKLLRDLVRVFNKDAVKRAKGDVFGRIYEFFLMKFSMQGAGAQEGGEFFTPPSLVNLIVNFIQPNHGIVHDPACGSGGMFVQTAHFIKNHENKSVNEAITVYGTELKSNNTRLAKMNLAIHGIEGKIIESNSFYSNPHNLTGKCDFVMANPPFNVDKIDAKNKFLADDDRLPFGPPLTGKGTVSNGNYLWMQYFYSYLNETGRAGFVMASSATDAGNAEKLIRQKLIETGDVECIVAISNNFFYTRSLPCHVWFFNKGKKKENKDKVLMIDARNTFRKVSTTINDFDDDQLEGLTAIMNAFRSNNVNLNGHAEPVEALTNVSSSAVENEWLTENFPKGIYEDVEGLCKIATLEEIKEQDYSLTPGRYVGVSIDIDMDFDYKTRMQEIHSELAQLNDEANSLMAQIQGVEL
ncbi:type I restriction-modification system subunit M [Mesoflavibacter zeaxanthinifaciens]|uniref:type I restriction-modification system subunit M n=1 Tax=Mesoflavibacter zeaxanthinifaciens TaxID=393060 RepID=UPI003A950E6D